MAVTLNELLQPQVIVNVVSRIRSGQGPLGRWLGFQPRVADMKNAVPMEGPNSTGADVRYGTFRLFDMARIVAPVRAPGTGPATTAPNPTGDVRFSAERFHLKIPLNYEQLGNLSPIIGPNSQIDTMGQDYIQRQIRHIGRRFNMTVELLSTGMLQDNLWMQFVGDTIWPVIGQPAAPAVSLQVQFNVPAGNKSFLNMLGTGNILNSVAGTGWNNVATPIIKQVLLIQTAFQQLTNFTMTDVWVNSNTWYNVIVNTEVRNLAGSANTPFASYDLMPDTGFDGQPTGEWYGVLRGIPDIRWHISNHVVITNSDVDPSYATAPAGSVIVKIIPDNVAFFLTQPSPEWCQMYYGGEPVVENPGMPAVMRRGYYFWKEYTTQPSGIDLIGLLNCVPLVYVPKSIAVGTVLV